MYVIVRYLYYIYVGMCEVHYGLKYEKKLIQSIIIKTILRKNKSKLYFSRTWKSSICSEIISTLILEIVVLLK